MNSTKRGARATRFRPRTVTAAIAAALAVALLATASPASAETTQPDEVSVVDGRTQPVFSYGDAVRERVYIPIEGVDQDLDGVTDRTAIDIIRPAEASSTLRMPAIIDPSPYYTTVGRGNESQLLTDATGDGLTDLFPLFYDNYFVPRGYAVIHAQMDGTGFSDGCPMHGGPGDIESMKVVIDWLQGRVPGYDADGDLVTAAWHNGRAGMIGKSYDGTLANGVAATGVEGLTTIVPIAAISDWYRYSRTGGIRHNTNYPASLSNTVTNPERRALCAPTRETMNAIDGDESGDVNEFWAERDYLRDVDNVRASVFAVHGLNDDNVRMSQFGDYWNALAAHDVPRKVWLGRVGHVDPFDFRRSEWVDTLHGWFDYWLQGVPNEIMLEPQSTVEFGPEEYVDEESWPAPGTAMVPLHLTGTPGRPGSLALTATADATDLVFTGPGNSPSENSLIADPEGQQNSRLVMLSEPLDAELRISGTPVVRLDAALDQEQSNLGALLVEYGTAERTPRGSGDGIRNLETRSCWGAASEYDNACYLDTERRSATSDGWRLSRGVLDSSNRDSLIEGEAVPVVPGVADEFDWPLEPYDHVFAAGSRIGVILTTNLSGFQAGAPGATVTIDAASSTLELPIVGGLDAAAAAGGLGAPAPVSLSFDTGDVISAPPTQSVDYGATPVEPAPPATDGELSFGGWYADAALTTPFDFAQPLRADATAYARWLTREERVAAIAVTPSALTVEQGGSVTLFVEGLDAADDSLGDVSEWAEVASSVSTDIVEGTTVSFPTASPHVLTVTVNGVSASVRIEVVAPAPPDASDDAEAPVVGAPAGDVGTGAAVTDPSLALTGSTVAIGTLLAAVLLTGAGAILLIARRARSGNASR